MTEQRLPSQAEARFELVSVNRAINGVVSAIIHDRKTGKKIHVLPYDSIGTFIVTEINFDTRQATLVDDRMVPATLKAAF